MLPPDFDERQRKKSLPDFHVELSFSRIVFNFRDDHILRFNQSCHLSKIVGESVLASQTEMEREMITHISKHLR
jgi:hypothetical protein